MSEQIRKDEQIEQDADLSEQDLDGVAGGGSEIGEIDVIIKKKPSGSGHSITPPVVPGNSSL